ncbi:MAG: hypothetical protein ABI539_08355 [Acidobacteriota bacterium]
MSVVLVTTVHECDMCKRRITLETFNQYEHFSEMWFDGLFKSFCPVCREMPLAKAQIEEESMQQRAFTRVLSRLRGAHVH